MITHTEDPVRVVMTTPVVSLDRDTTLRTAAMVMRDKAIGAVAVIGRRGLIGIVSERDLVRSMADGLDPDLLGIGAVMSESLQPVDAGASLREAADMMIELGVRHLPVVVGDEVVGMLSIRDALGGLCAP
jgi:CBS domain-containing protein